MNIKAQLDELNKNDIYSLILFILYKSTNLPEYSSLSQLAYTLDKDNLLKLCNIFGGQTLYIPTLDELEKLIYGLMLYQYIDIDHLDYDCAFNLLNLDYKDDTTIKKDITLFYNKVKHIINDYVIGV